MSLTSRIQGSQPADKALQEILRSTLPPKEAFKTLSGTRPFAVCDYSILAPYALSRRTYSGVVGTAFDYLARAVVARTIDDGKNHCLQMLVAEFGLRAFQRWEPLMGTSSVQEVQGVYDRALTTVADYVYDRPASSYAPTVASCCKLARFDYVARNGSFAEDPLRLAGVHRLLLTDEPSEIIDDLDRLIDAFARTFIISGLINRRSEVIFNPKFVAPEIGGADADILVDSTLYDFKTCRSPGYKWQDIAQLWGYYLLAQLRGIHDAASMAGDASVKDTSINRLALYKARFGEVEYVDVAQLVERVGRAEAADALDDYLHSLPR